MEETAIVAGRLTQDLSIWVYNNNNNKWLIDIHN